MVLQRITKPLIALLFTCYSLPSLALDPNLNWKSLHSAHFILHFPESYEQTAQQISHLAEKVHQRLAPQFEWQPQQPTHLVLNDHVDLANGNATVVPYNRIELNLFPPLSSSELGDFNQWMTTLLIHEYSHILHLDKKTGLPARLKHYLGHQVLFYPNLYQPTWLTEGLATHLETDDLNQTGRRQSSLFHTMMRAELGVFNADAHDENTSKTKNSFKSLAQVNGHQTEWPLNTNYLYGAFFYEFLEQRYGQEAIFDFVTAYSNNWLPYGLNTTSKEIFHQNFASLWQEFEQWLPSHLAQQPASSGKGNVVNAVRLTHHGAFTGPIRPDKDTLYYLKDDGYQHATIMQRTTAATPVPLIQVAPGSQFDHHPNAGFVVAQLDHCDPYRIFYDLYLFKETTLQNQQNNQPGQQITRCGRYHEVAWHPNGKSIAAITTRKGRSEIHLLSISGKIERILKPPTDATILTAIDWNQDGQFLVTSAHHYSRGQWDIAEYSLQRDQWQWITQDPAIDSQPQYSPSGEFIVFSREDQQTLSAYQYHRQSNAFKQLTHYPTTALHPHLTHDNALVYVGYHDQGFDIYQQPNKPQLPSEAGQTLAQITPDSSSLSATQSQRFTEQAQENTKPDSTHASLKDYSPWPTLFQTTWLPIFDYQSGEGARIGVSFSGNDPLNFHRYQWGGYLDTFADEPGGFFNYQYNDRFFITLDRNNRFFVDASDALLVKENRDSAALFYRLPWLKREKQWHLFTGFAVENHHFKNINWPFAIPSNRDYLIGTALFFDNSRRYLYGISRTQGRQVYAALEWVQESHRRYSGAATLIDWREYIAIGQRSVLAFRQVLAATEENANPFELGDDFRDDYQAFSNVFNRREFALRGYKNNFVELQGKYLSLSSLEWRFPLLNIERSLMAPPLGIGKIHGALFFDSGNAWGGFQQGSALNAHSLSDWHSSVGAEMVIQWRAFYSVNLLSRIGAVSALGSLGEDQLYATVGLSF